MRTAKIRDQSDLAALRHVGHAINNDELIIKKNTIYLPLLIFLKTRPERFACFIFETKRFQKCSCILHGQVSSACHIDAFTKRDACFPNSSADKNLTGQLYDLESPDETGLACQN